MRRNAAFIQTRGRGPGTTQPTNNRRVVAVAASPTIAGIAGYGHPNLPVRTLTMAAPLLVASAFPLVALAALCRANSSSTRRGRLAQRLAVLSLVRPLLLAVCAASMLASHGRTYHSNTSLAASVLVSRLAVLAWAVSAVWRWASEHALVAFFHGHEWRDAWAFDLPEAPRPQWEGRARAVGRAWVLAALSTLAHLGVRTVPARPWAPQDSVAWVSSLLRAVPTITFLPCVPLWYHVAAAGGLLTCAGSLASEVTSNVCAWADGPLVLCDDNDDLSIGQLLLRAHMPENDRLLLAAMSRMYKEHSTRPVLDRIRKRIQLDMAAEYFGEVTYPTKADYDRCGLSPDEAGSDLRGSIPYHVRPTEAECRAPTPDDGAPGRYIAAERFSASGAFPFHTGRASSQIGGGAYNATAATVKGGGSGEAGAALAADASSAEDASLEWETGRAAEARAAARGWPLQSPFGALAATNSLDPEDLGFVLGMELLTGGDDDPAAEE